ncbi:six-hairpin glycosidase [Diplogelasinospora grovesii]|uniref:Six-hairpin glycosidase n=1 Tax=Diplogelasinospora grovesii TaxID=303347 RepID=A0AAN6MZC9_9PEZI|nr:six-hairpin glycosidase [Diplogelasinospora grovesii]
MARKSLYRGLAAVTATQSVSALLDAPALARQYFGNDAAWYLDRIPFFESSDANLTSVYYYRWSIFRAHQRDLGGADGYISTEFLNDVSWQTNPWGSLNDATGFHLLEGRWCRDRRFKEDYATFMLGPHSNTRQYSESMADGVWQGYLVDGVAADAVSRIDAMRAVYDAWTGDSYDASKGLYWVEPLRDATEYTISSIDASGGYDGFTGGQAFRPSINSYQYANAMAIANLAALKGDTATAANYTGKADAIRTLVHAYLWNSTFNHFIDRHYASNLTAGVSYWQPIRGRELVGYVPWTHNLANDNATLAAAWSHMLDSTKLRGTHGLRTNEPSYQYYMRQYRYDAATGRPECQWNGPAWPYQTTQVLAGLANLLDHYPLSSASGVITRADYTRLLLQYVALHYNPNRGGTLALEEDYNADTGAPIVGLPRSPHYFHSGFVDLVLTGFVGLRPRSDDVLEVNPQADPGAITYFRVDRIMYHGREVAVQWDATGSRYGAAGLRVEVDGKAVATSPTLTRLTVSNFAGKAPAAISRPVAVSVQVLPRGSSAVNTTYPVGSTSVSPDPNVNSVHDAIDGRIMFYPETDAANGWDSPVGGQQVWYQVDFGKATRLQSAEIAFFADASQSNVAPKSYTVQTLNGNNKWVDVGAAKYAAPVANGITWASWAPVTANKTRILFTPPAGNRVRLVEFKLFSELVTA